MPAIATGQGSYPSSGVILPSAARTATVVSPVLGATGASGLMLVVNVTSITLTPSVVFTIEGLVWPAGNTPGATPVAFTLLTSAAVTATGTTVLQVAPGLTPAANAAASSVLPDSWRVTATHGDTDSITYSVVAILVP